MAATTYRAWWCAGSARAACGGPSPAFAPGQYVSVRVELADGARQIRQYSLSGAPADSTRSITVKRVHEVSGHLHDHVRVGDRVELSAPYGDLVLADTGAPLLLASAGIGCTPMLSMLHHLVDIGYEAPVTVIHGDQTPYAHALGAVHRALIGKLPHGTGHFWYEEAAEEGNHPGRVDLAELPSLRTDVQAYLCGPLPFMRSIRSQLLERGVPASAVHYEVFGPDLWLGRS